MGRPSAHARCLGSPLTPLGLRLCGPKAVTKFAAPGGGTAKDWATVAGSSRPTSPLASAKGDPRKEKVLLNDSLCRRESALPAGPVAFLASSLPQRAGRPTGPEGRQAGGHWAHYSPDIAAPRHWRGLPLCSRKSLLGHLLQTPERAASRDHASRRHPLLLPSAAARPRHAVSCQDLTRGTSGVFAHCPSQLPWESKVQRAYDRILRICLTRSHYFRHLQRCSRQSWMELGVSVA